MRTGFIEGQIESIFLATRLQHYRAYLLIFRLQISEDTLRLHRLLRDLLLQLIKLEEEEK